MSRRGRYEYEGIWLMMCKRHRTMLEVAKVADISATTLSAKLFGRTPFTLDEAYAIMGYLKIPETDFSLYFPPRGKSGIQDDLV